MLDICVVHRNRSVVHHKGHRLVLFPRCIEALIAAAPACPWPIRLWVANWDVEGEEFPLRAWLMKAVHNVMPCTILRMLGPWSKGRATNTCAAAAGDHLFFLDADMLVPRAGLLSVGIEALQAGKVWFPNYLAQTPLDPAAPVPPCRPGTGNCFIRREHLDQMGGWPEEHEWGKDDTSLALRVQAAGLLAEPLATRQPVAGFVHMWHPKYLGWPTDERSAPCRQRLEN